MFAMFSRILKLSGRYKGRIQGAFVCAFLESILSKMPIVLAFVVLSRFAADTLTSQTCLYIGLGLAHDGYRDALLQGVAGFEGVGEGGYLLLYFLGQGVELCAVGKLQVLMVAEIQFQFEE